MSIQGGIRSILLMNLIPPLLVMMTLLNLFPLIFYLSVILQNLLIIVSPFFFSLSVLGFGNVENGWGFEKDGLYLLDTSSKIASLVHQVAMSPKSLNKSSPKESYYNSTTDYATSLLYKMSHLPFSSCSKLHCEMAKHYRSVYPISNKRISFPFNIVHYDV